MAYRIHKPEPIQKTVELKPLGFNLPFSINSILSVNYSTNTTLKNNIITYLLTERGERLFNPEFGLPLRQYFFDEESFAEKELKRIIQVGISNEFPEIQLQKTVIVKPENDETSYVVYIKYETVQGRKVEEVSVTVMA